MEPLNWRAFVLASAWLALGMGDEPKKVARPALEMSKAVVCQSIEGYEKYEPLPDASLTSEDKLNIYFRPLNSKVEPVEKPRPGRRFRSRFVEDCRLRRKGEKTLLQTKDKLLEYDANFATADERPYLVNNISMKGLAPGDYELDIVLHDDLVPDSSATQTVSFTIVPTPKVEGAEEPKAPPVPAPVPDPKKPPAKTKPGKVKP